MEIFATLSLAHLLGDFPLQTNRIFKMKMEGHKGLFIHVAIHLVTLALLIRHPWKAWPLLLTLGVAHYITDWAKLHIPARQQAPGFLVDQLIHFITLAILTRAFPGIEPLLPGWVLYVALLLAVVPAVMMYLWVLDNDRRPFTGANGCVVGPWNNQSLLFISQQIGWVIVAGVAATGLSMYMPFVTFLK